MSKRFTGFPAIVDAINARDLDATFMLAPLAMVLAREGSRPVRIVHLGHRDGTALVVPKDSPYKTFADLRGKKIAIPHRYSNQRILIEKLKDQFGFTDNDVTLIDYAPPEMPAALKAGSFDAFIVGEPNCAKAELGGYGRVMYLTKDIWPNFISCVLVVAKDAIDSKPGLVQELVTGITSSGYWIDQGPQDKMLEGIYLDDDPALPKDQIGLKDPFERQKIIVMKKDFGLSTRMQAAQIGGLFYGQPPDLLKYVLSSPPDRVRYVDLMLAKKDFEEIQKYAERLKFFSKRPVTEADPFRFEDYTDDRFEKGSMRAMPYRN